MDKWKQSSSVKKANSEIDAYLKDGCGRCSLAATPKCKVNYWQKELVALRKILLKLDLTEELKWKIPCYTWNKRNIVLLSAFKEYCAISFFKGTLLKDKKAILIKPGENSQATRQLRFHNCKEIKLFESEIFAYVKEAIELEKAGLKVDFKKNPEPIPEEFQQKMDASLALKTAFEGLTPGRQRAYILYFSAPKQSKTRIIRIEKYLQKILNGKGINDN